MKKILSIIIIISVIFAMSFGLAKVFAVTINKEEKNTFFKVSETEISVEDTLEMTIDLNEIKYDNFTFTLQANVNVENVKVETEKANSVKTEYDEEEKGLVIEVDKTKIDVDTILLYYKIPENLKVGNTINFVATITDNEESNTKNTENIIGNNTLNNISAKTQESEELTVTITIIENQEEDTEKNETEKNVEITEKANEIASTQTNNIENEKQVTTNNSQLTTVSGNNSSASTTKSNETAVTYNGSDNNYLNKLEVSGYEFTSGFTKENTTYFTKINGSISEIEINAVAEDEDATICVYGNDNLVQGTNKILISVTAENGNVRTYRIIATVEGE